MLTREQIEAMDEDAIRNYIGVKVYGCEPPWGDEFCPSDNLSQAIEAAEKVGLDLEIASYFRNKKHLAKCVSPKRYFLWYEAPTPALAVCRAIIAAHEAKK